MPFDEPGWPLIDDFFRSLAAGRADVTVRRYARVHNRLVGFLDTADMTLGLGDERSMLLDAEREFHDSGAFWTLYGPDELVECLPSFLHETWLPAGAGESRVQVSAVSRLLAHLLRGRMLSERVLDGQVQSGQEQCGQVQSGSGTSSAVSQVSAAIEQAQRLIEERAPAPAGEPPQMPARFRQPPGPQW